MIKRALPGNNVGNKIITTTRILNIAEQAGCAYKLPPISLNNSQKLFFRRIFGNDNKDNNEEEERCENNLDMENMRKILSFSYYVLSCHLRTYLLYLSMFPEDYEIEKDRLIMMWIGEDFIQCEKSGKSLFELGENYFTELINRSMIQPMHNSSDDMVPTCHVHDMVLDLICSLLSEENFVTILSDMGGTS
uniref:Disease resistance protein winged helix domain-containing protein n=1 Tax=Setaria viridis TaxID=4556 RepID=A0A4U6TVQ5_SETVI|nr:hypothetical protein SEVIR_8G203766v2 [Setaria viridis]